MFGMSFTKIALLVLIVAVVWFGFRWFQRWEKERRGDQPEQKRPIGGMFGRFRDHPAPATATEDMSACRVCGVYVASRTAVACGRANCPFPRA